MIKSILVLALAEASGFRPNAPLPTRQQLFSSLDQYSPPKAGDFTDIFCRSMNDAFRKLTIKPVRDYCDIKVTDTGEPLSFFQIVQSAPQIPGIPRPVSLTIAASIPTALGWYGFYKFSVEEELFHDELRISGRATGCGGYGTLLPFVWLFLLGGITNIIPGLHGVSSTAFEAGGAWILGGQINLYRRVNELSMEAFGPSSNAEPENQIDEPPLYAWWALLPPPLDVVVGLRQVHALAKYWASIRGEPLERDAVAEELFPFIASERFTLKQFLQEPRRWFWFTGEYDDIDYPALVTTIAEKIPKSSNP